MIVYLVFVIAISLGLGFTIGAVLFGILPMNAIMFLWLVFLSFTIATTCRLIDNMIRAQYESEL